MKLKSLRKLALSGVALAAAATTLGTSTFAWYITNSTATASGVEGTVQAGAGGNVLLAQNATGSSAVSETGSTGSHGAWSQTLSYLNSTSQVLLQLQVYYLQHQLLQQLLQTLLLQQLLLFQQLQVQLYGQTRLVKHKLALVHHTLHLIYGYSQLKLMN
jgi:hypothetical protein